MAYGIDYISKFSSINFEEKWKKNFDEQKEYVQLFSIEDEIKIQAILIDSDRQWVLDNIYCLITNLESEDEVRVYATSTGITWGDNLIISFNLEGAFEFPGLYEIKLKHGKFRFGLSYIRIVEDDDARLTNTVHIRYSNRINYFDTSFINQDGTINQFSFRVEGGFEESEKQFKVSSNNSRDQRYTETQLSALPYRIKRMTVGTKKGVPEWVGEKINLILSCSEITINNVEHVRSEGAEPEISVLKDYYPLFVYKIDVEELDNYKTKTEYIEEYEPVLRTALQFTGTQWINSGITQKYELLVRMIVRLYNYTSKLWGSSYSNGAYNVQSMTIVSNENPPPVYLNSRNENFVNISRDVFQYIDGNIHEIEWMNGRVKIDGNVLITENAPNGNRQRDTIHYIGCQHDYYTNYNYIPAMMDLVEIEFKDPTTNEVFFYGYAVKAGEVINGQTAPQNCLYDEISNSFKLPNLPLDVIQI